MTEGTGAVRRNRTDGASRPSSVPTGTEARSGGTKASAASLPKGVSLPKDLAILVTKGAAGADYILGDQVLSAPAHPVEAVDTTGAGDTFLGYFLARLDAADGVEAALATAMAAAALQVTRQGAVAAIPNLAEVHDFLASL